MAFDLDFLGRISSTANSKAQTTWSYTSATDTLATIRADEYFNNATSLRTNDVLNIKGSDGHKFYIVLGIDPYVTIERYGQFSVLGDWDDRSIDTEYTEIVDGFAHGWIESTDSSPGRQDEGRLEAVSPAGVQVGACKTDTGDQYLLYIASVTIPVKAGVSWQMVSSDISGAPTYKVVFMPFTLERFA